MCTVLLFLSSEDQQQGRMEVYGSSCWGSRFSYGVHPNRDSIHKEINHYSVPARIIGSLNNHNVDDSDNIKNNWFYEQNSLACASRILVHFFDVHCTTTMWNHLVWRFMKDAVNKRLRSFLTLQDSTPGEIAYIIFIIIQIMQVQIDKVWKDTNSSLAMFSLPSSSSCAVILAFCSQPSLQAPLHHIQVEFF